MKVSACLIVSRTNVLYEKYNLITWWTQRTYD